VKDAPPRPAPREPHGKTVEVPPEFGVGPSRIHVRSMTEGGGLVNRRGEENPWMFYPRIGDIL